MAKLPGDVHKLRSSERSTFKKCPQQWWWAYVEGLRSTMSESTALWFGTGMHLAWAEYYIPGQVRGRDPHDTWEEFCQGKEVDTIRVTDGEDQHVVFLNAIELGHAMIDGYLAEYGGDPDWEVLAPEQRVRAILPHPKDPSRPYVDMVGTMDLVVRDHSDGLIKVVDHKHMAQLKLSHLDLDEQLAGYVTIAEHSLRKDGIIGPKEKVAGIIYNVLVKSKPDLRPRDSEGRYRNKPTKVDYIEALVAEAHKNGAYESDADREGKTVEQIEAEDRKAMVKMKVAEVEAEAEAIGITVFGAISKQQGTKKFAREFIPLTSRQRARQLKRISEDMYTMNAVRAKKLPLMKSPADHCSWCQFKDLCLLDEAGGDTEDFKRMVFQKEDPYADHREGAENSKTSVLLKRKTGVN